MNTLDKQILDMYDGGGSTHTIAKTLNTYPNKIKRILEKHGRQLRDRKSAQQNAESQGRYVHPTKGKKHNKEVRAKISERVHQQWANLSDAEKEAKRKQAKQNWDNLSDEHKEELQQKAHKAIRLAADVGSKMELFLVDYLMNAGYDVCHHSTHKVGAENMELDILLPVDKIVIEIDGPSHFEPIWGEDALKRNRKADNKKNGLLLSNGINVIRVRDKSKKFTRKIERNLVQCVVEAIEKIQKSTSKKPQLIFTEVSNV